MVTSSDKRKTGKKKSTSKRKSVDEEKGRKKNVDEEEVLLNVEDDRFKQVQYNPKFSKTPKDKSKIKVDKRFEKMFTDSDFTDGSTGGKVDKYGRKVDKNDKHGNSELKKFYRMDEEEEEEEEDESEVETKNAKKKNKKGKKNKKKDEKKDRAEYLNMLARGEIELESSSDEDEEQDEKDDDDDSVDIGLEDDEDVEIRDKEEDIPLGEATRRIAIQNLDWARLNAQDILAVLQSFLPPGGQIENVSVYQSQFGEERMKLEESLGPQIDYEDNEVEGEESTKHTGGEDGEEVVLAGEADLAGEGEDFHIEKFRKYELDKLKYYFAIATCDTVETANALYTNCDGVEFNRSSIVFDLRFVPDEVEIDRPLRDSAEEVSEEYEPPSFYNKALQSSKVELTWDEDDYNRQDMLKKWGQKPARGRRIIGDKDLEAFIGSDNDDDEEEDEEEEAKRMKSAELLRAALAESDSDSDDDEEKEEDNKEESSSELVNKKKKKTDKDKEMQFYPDLKERLKEKSRKHEQKFEAEGNNQDDQDISSNDREKKRKQHLKKKADDFKDPFFSNPNSRKNRFEKEKQKKNKKNRKNDDSMDEDEDDDDDNMILMESEEKRRAREQAELELLLLDDKKKDSKKDNFEGFDYNAIVAGEKLLKKKSKHKGKGKKREKNLQAIEAAKNDTFQVDTKDSRFASLYEDPDFSLDRTDNRYSGSKGLLEIEKEQLKKRGEKKRKRTNQNPSSNNNNNSKETELSNIVNSIKNLTNKKKKKL